jgi:hypothetical protein
VNQVAVHNLGKLGGSFAESLVLEFDLARTKLIIPASILVLDLDAQDQVVEGRDVECKGFTELRVVTFLSSGPLRSIILIEDLNVPSASSKSQP